MPRDMMDLPLIGRAAEVREASVDPGARTVEIVWTTGATVQRVRWEGWDDRIEYDEELVVDTGAVRLERLNAGAPFLNAHYAWDAESVIGSVVPGSVRLEGGQGFATIRLTEAEDARGIVQRILEKSLRFVSVGYRVHRYEITKPAGQREHWRAVDWEPLEISAVPIPADPGAQLRSGYGRAAALAPCVLARRDDTAAISPAANPKGDQTMSGKNQAAAVEAGRHDDAPAPETRASETPEAAAPARAAAPAVDAEAIRAEERRRVSTITGLCARHGLDATFSAGLVERGVSVDEARTAILDHLAGAQPDAVRAPERAPATASDQTRDAQYADALTTAMLHRHDPGRVELSPGAREFRGLSLLEMARHALERGGVSTRGLSRMELASAAFQRRGAGYMSTSDFPAILANVAGKTLRAAYDSTPRTFAAWARRATISDFKPVSRTQLGGAPDLEKVLESGEFQYGTIGEGKEVYALASYGRIVAVTRQALINDDLDAFTRIPAAFGASAADLESEIVYSILMDNPDMADGIDLFHASHGNLGSAAVISEAALAAAYRAFGQKTGLEGRLVSILPQFILVPPGVRSVEARKQVTATTPGSTAEVNTFAGRLQVIEEPRLIPSAGQDPWFLAADPSRIDTVEYAFLEGQEGVYTETRMGFEVDGMEIKARHDFAAKAIDWRGLYKNPGLAPT